MVLALEKGIVIKGMCCLSKSDLMIKSAIIYRSVFLFANNFIRVKLKKKITMTVALKLLLKGETVEVNTYIVRHSDCFTVTTTSILHALP